MGVVDFCFVSDDHATHVFERATVIQINNPKTVSCVFACESNYLPAVCRKQAGSANDCFFCSWCDTSTWLIRTHKGEGEGEGWVEQDEERTLQNKRKSNLRKDSEKE